MGGLLIGTALLNMDHGDFSAPYQDSSNRAATFDSPLANPVPKSGNDMEISVEETFEPDANTSATDNKFDASVSFDTPPPRIEAAAEASASGEASPR
jgi:hypothetical protein